MLVLLVGKCVFRFVLGDDVGVVDMFKLYVMFIVFFVDVFFGLIFLFVECMFLFVDEVVMLVFGVVFV